MSQLFRGFTKAIQAEEKIQAESLAIACEKAVETAYKAVMKPKEGTILTVASGIAKWYTPESLVGKKVVVVSNLKPATLCGVESNGMILAADCSETDVKVLFLDSSIPNGSKVR